MMDGRVIDKKLTEGGTAEVFLSKEKEVLKMAKDPVHLNNIHISNEVDVLSDVYHDSIPRLIAPMNSAERKGIVMSYLTGENLKLLIDKKQANFNWREVRNFGVQLTDIVEAFHSHEKNYIVRDIKPSNILLNQDKLQLCDFGMTVSSFEKNIKAFGTIGYAAPEQFESGVADIRSDIFSIGATLYYMVSGGKSVFTTNPENQLKGSAPQSFIDIIMKATKNDMDDRFEDVHSLKSALLNSRYKWYEKMFGRR